MIKMPMRTIVSESALFEKIMKSEYYQNCVNMYCVKDRYWREKPNIDCRVFGNWKEVRIYFTMDKTDCCLLER